MDATLMKVRDLVAKHDPALEAKFFERASRYEQLARIVKRFEEAGRHGHETKYLQSIMFNLARLIARK